MKRHRLQGLAPAGRRAAAMVEFAICLPVIVLVVLGSIEAASAIFIRQAMAVAAYEGIRQAVRRDGDAESASTAARDVLSQRSVRSATIEFEPSDLSTLERGEPAVIRITAGMKANSPFFGRILEDRQITVATTMVRE